MRFGLYLFLTLGSHDILNLFSVSVSLDHPPSPFEKTTMAWILYFPVSLFDRTKTAAVSAQATTDTHHQKLKLHELSTSDSITDLTALLPDDILGKSRNSPRKYSSQAAAYLCLASCVSPSCCTPTVED